ncbi:MAG: hypothetical protein OEY11_02385 [Gammaproteobacteria bacterium]|nr:hypothetical protein [Gammaproteobacteria bacterium]
MVMIGYHRLSIQINTKDLRKVEQFVFNPLATVFKAVACGGIKPA